VAQKVAKQHALTIAERHRCATSVQRHGEHVACRRLAGAACHAEVQVVALRQRVDRRVGRAVAKELMDRVGLAHHPGCERVARGQGAPGIDDVFGQVDQLDVDEVDRTLVRAVGTQAPPACLEGHAHAQQLQRPAQEGRRLRCTRELEQLGQHVAKRIGAERRLGCQCPNLVHAMPPQM
jgi:hypothetical protein